MVDTNQSLNGLCFSMRFRDLTGDNYNSSMSDGYGKGEDDEQSQGIDRQGEGRHFHDRLRMAR